MKESGNSRTQTEAGRQHQARVFWSRDRPTWPLLFQPKVLHLGRESLKKENSNELSLSAPAAGLFGRLLSLPFGATVDHRSLHPCFSAWNYPDQRGLRLWKINSSAFDGRLSDSWRR